MIMQFFRRQLRLTWLVCLSLALPPTALAQTTTPPPLAPEAQEALDKGVLAAKQQDFLLAVRYFQDARKLAPQAPEIYYDLGLAEGQLPGRELRAICWFEGYLALVHHVFNAPAVRQQIIDLDVRAEGNAQKMIGLLKGPVAQFSKYKRREAQAQIASLEARSGDLEAARAILDQSNDYERDEVRSAVLSALVESNDFAEATKLANQFKDEVYKTRAYEDIASGQIETGLLSEAKISLGVISDSNSKYEYYRVLFRLAEAEYQVGQPELAATLLRDAKASIDKLTDFNAPDRERYVIQFAVAEYKTGQREAGEHLLMQISSSMGELSSLTSTSVSNSQSGDKYGNRMSLLEHLAEAFHEIGQREKALQCLDETAQAQIAGNAAHEINPYSITYTYIEMQEWDRAKTQALRETTEDYNKGGWSKKEKADFVASRADDIANAKIAIIYASAKSSSLKTVLDVASSDAQRAQAWCDYLTATMNTPLFTDFKTTLGGLANPGGDEIYKDTTAFGNVEKQAEVLVSRLKDIRDLRDKQIKVER